MCGLLYTCMDNKVPRASSTVAAFWSHLRSRKSSCFLGSLVYHYNRAQWYEQFLQVGRLDQALILLGFALYLSSTSVSSTFMVLCIFNFSLHSLQALRILSTRVNVTDTARNLGAMINSQLSTVAVCSSHCLETIMLLSDNFVRSSDC